MMLIANDYDYYYVPALFAGKESSTRPTLHRANY